MPSRDTYFNWDDMTSLKVRNKSRNQMGQLIGTGIGALASYLLVEAAENSSTERVAFFPLFLIIEIPVITLTGTLIGHLATKKKTDIPLDGLNSKDRNQLLKSTIQKKK